MKTALFTLACAFVAAQANAQKVMDPSRVEPITAPLEDGGVYDWVTGRWHATPSVLAATPRVIYDNTCNPGTTGIAPCEDFYDEGRIPSLSSPSVPQGATNDNQVTSFKFGYCTRYPTGQVDIKVAFFNTLAAGCAGGTAVTPPPWSQQATAVFDFGAATGFPLPGSLFLGSEKCQTVTISNVNFCLQSDGDGVFDGQPSFDNFAFGLTSPNPQIGMLQTKFYRAGNPNTAAPGTCTYNIPCAGPPNTPCGSGLDSTDNWWVNQDNQSVGSNVPCQTGAATGGTGCYFFGGYPGNPFASFYMKLESPGACGACTPGLSYCTSQITSNGCVPAISATGLPSLANPAGYVVTTSQVETTQSGTTFFGVTGQNNVPFLGGILCVKATLYRLPIQFSGGAGTCSGVITYSLQNFLNQPDGGGLLLAGTTVNAQTWFRDPPSSATTALSNGWEFVICP